MSPPVPSSINRMAQNVVTEYCVAKGQLVGFVENDWLEQRIFRLIRDTIVSEHERCAKACEAKASMLAKGVGSSSKVDARIRHFLQCADAIRNLPIAP